VVQSLNRFQYSLPNGNPAIHQQLVYQVFAPTAEEAEQRARAIIQLYDNGLWREMRNYALQKGQQSLEDARAQLPELAKQQEASRKEEELLAKQTEITPDILAQLKAQKIMVAVELAGLNARVKACDAMLADARKLELNALQSVSDMKVKAEIERVGTKERLDQINTFVAEGDNRLAAQFRLSVSGSKISGIRSGIYRSTRTAERYSELYDLYAPFALVDDQIKVSPIEWTQQ
jgi:hypothetical protein